MLRKRVVSALLAIAMVLSCLIPLAACGASAEGTGGSIRTAEKEAAKNLLALLCRSGGDGA